MWGWNLDKYDSEYKSMAGSCERSDEGLGYTNWQGERL
jgi:hypothetical protein